MTLGFQTIHVPLGIGLNQKADPRALQPPELTRALDVQFDEIGGLQTRYPFGLLAAEQLDIDDNPVSDFRRLERNGDELLMFTRDALYSWNAKLSRWVSKGTHLAVKLEEQNRFVTGRDQADCDRAELENTVFYAWTENVSGVGIGYVAAVDKTTGSVLMQPAVLASGYATRVRLTALETKVLLAYVDGSFGSGVFAYLLDPAAPATALAGSATTLANLNSEDWFDIVRVPDSDQAVFAARCTPSTSYTVGTIDEAGTVTRSTKARDCTGPIAVSCPPTGTHVQIIRDNSAAIEGDYIEIAGLVDVYTSQAIGTATVAANQIAAAHRSDVDGSEYRCYVFWSSDRSVDGGAQWQSRSNWVDTGGVIGSDATFLRRTDVGSRAFDRDGRVYVWMMFGNAGGTYGQGGNLQNAYYLYRDDGFLAAKSTWNRGGGFLDEGYLPGVQDLGGDEFAFCATERTIFQTLVTSTNFSGRRPRDVTFAFDCNEARRCVRLGRTLYIPGGELLQYDGVRLTEVGFHVWPWYYESGFGAPDGDVEDGTYGIKISYRSDNAQAERDRSAALRIDTVTVAGGLPRHINVLNVVPLYITHKPTLAVEVWRSQVNPTADSPYYLASSSDPTLFSNPNRFLLNDKSADFEPTLQDELGDDDLSALGENPQDVTLPSLAPPASTIIAANDTRVFLAGIAGEPNNVWYSKQRAEGELAAFHGSLFAPVPPDGGPITAIAFLSETLVVFCGTAIFVLPGDGYDNTGGGSNYGPARTISLDIGAVNQEGVALTDRGLIFKSNKGWYLLTKGWGLDYIGGPIADYDSLTPIAIQVVDSQHQVRVLLEVPTLGPVIVEDPDAPLDPVSRMLVLDTIVSDVNQRPTWAEWSINDGLHACMWNGAHVYLSSNGPKQQLTEYTGVDYGMDIELAFVRPAQYAGQCVIRNVFVLGEVRSACDLRVRLARDDWKDGVDTYFQDKPWTVTPATAGAPLRYKRGPSIKRMTAIKVRLTAQAVGVEEPPSGEAMKLTGIAFDVGVEGPFNHRLPAAQKG